MTDEKLQKSLEDNYAFYGYDSVEEFEKSIDLQDYRDSLLINEVAEFLLKHALVIEKEENN